MSHDAFKVNSSISMNNDDHCCLPSEKEIMAEWGSNVCQVSVLCVVYNHEEYISIAIESFLKQRTDFAFEIVIHDDASTDGSASVIAHYQSLYPNIIKPILQKENQYSKAPNSIFVIGAEKCSSDYIALCEGDDYWISKNKLQVQYEALKKMPDINISFHSYETERGCFVNRSFINKSARIVPHKKMVINGPSYVALASVMAKKKVIIATFNEFLKCPVGDFFLQIMASWPKGALYVAGVKSYYRTASLGSWTEVHTNQALEAKVTHWEVIAKNLKVAERQLGASSIFSRLYAYRLITLLSVVKEDRALFDEVLSRYLNSESDLRYRLFFRLALYELWRRPSMYVLVFLLRVKNYKVSRWVSLF